MDSKTGAWLCRKRVMLACEDTILDIRSARSEKVSGKVQEAHKRWIEKRRGMFGWFSPEHFDFDNATEFYTKHYRMLSGMQERTATDILQLTHACKEENIWVTSEDFNAIEHKWRDVL